MSRIFKVHNVTDGVLPSPGGYNDIKNNIYHIIGSDS